MFVWFSRKVLLQGLLDQWTSRESNYDPDQPADASWQVDGYEKVLSPEPDPALYQRAVEALFRYHFYPPEVLTFYSDFMREGRPMRNGDRIIQRIPIIPAVLELICMNEVRHMIIEPHRRGFTYFSSIQHVEMGEWTAAVVQKRSGEIALMVHSISKTDPRRIPPILQPLARRLQLRAHRLGLAHFQQIVEDSA